jgi:hypothetical protein
VHHVSVRTSALLIIAGILAWVSYPSGTASQSRTLPRSFEVSFVPGHRDDGGHFMGGTEVRVLAGHRGKLFAGNGYWKDRPGAEGVRGAQILVLDASGARWRADHTFDERMENGYPRYLAVSALREVRFTTDWKGTPLPEPASLLLASFGT